MKSVWVIEQGSYSDYRVVGVFSSKKNAEIVCEAINEGKKWEEATIAEWPLDPAVDELNAGRTQWSVVMLKDGTVERCDKQGIRSYNIGGEHHLWERTKALAYRGQKDIQDALTVTVWATDKKHAIKVANEIR